MISLIFSSLSHVPAHFECVLLPAQFGDVLTDSLAYDRASLASQRHPSCQLSVASRRSWPRKRGCLEGRNYNIIAWK
jgi:hypothetical protein